MTDPIGTTRTAAAAPAPPAGAPPGAGGRRLSDGDVRALAGEVLQVGRRTFWAADHDARIDRAAEVMQGLDIDSRARLVAELLNQDGGALHHWLQGDRVNELVDDGRIGAAERTALMAGMAEAYDRGQVSFTQLQSFLGAATDRAPALAGERFNGARALMAGAGPEITAARERFVRDAFAQTAARARQGFGNFDQTSAFAAQLALDGGQQALLAREFGRLGADARRAVAQELGDASIGYANSRAAVAGLGDPLAALVQAARAQAPTDTEPGRQMLVHIAEGLGAAHQRELEPQATALYREVALARAQAQLTSPEARAQGLARIARANDAAARLLATLPPDATPAQVAAIVRTHRDALVAPVFTQYLELRTDAALPLTGAALRNDIGMAMGLPPNRAPQGAQQEAQFNGGSFDIYGGDAARAIAEVERQIAAVGGPGARVAALPVTVSSDQLGLLQLPLWRVEGADGRQRFVDYNPATGEARSYSNFEDWRTNNRLPPGEMTYPADGHLTADASGRPRLVTENTPGTADTFWEQWGQPVADGVALVGGVVLLGAAAVGTGGGALLVGGALLGAYGAARGGAVVLDRARHGHSVDPLASAEARNAWLNVGAGVLGFAAAGASLRLAGAAGRAASGLDDAAQLGRLALTARGLNVATQYVDTATLVDTGYSLAANWDRLTPQQRVAALSQMAFWAGGTAVAARGGGGMANLYGVGDMSAALARANQWMRHQLPPGMEMQQVLASVADTFVPGPGQRLMTMSTPDGQSIKVLVAEMSASRSGGGQATNGADVPPLVRPGELSAWRSQLGVPDDLHTFAVARSDVPGLNGGQPFRGASPEARRQAGLGEPLAGPILSPSPIPRGRNHAEQDIANQFVAAVRAAGLTPADLRGRVLEIEISHPGGVCSTCRQGLSGRDVPPGVLKQLSDMYPELTIRVTVTAPAPGSEAPRDVLLVRGGARIN